MSRLTFAKPPLFIILGLPGAGKSFFARQFHQANHVPLIATDRIRHELFEQPLFNKEELQTTLRITTHMAENMLPLRHGLIVDGGLSMRKHRRELCILAAKYDYIPLIIWVQTDMDTAFNRASNRDRRKTDDKHAVPISLETFNRLRKQFTPPTNEEYVVISGKHVFNTQYRSVVRKMQSKGFFATSPVQSNVAASQQSNQTDHAHTQRPPRVDYGRRRIVSR